MTMNSQQVRAILAQLSNCILHHLKAVIQNQDVDPSHCLRSLFHYILASLVAPQVCLDKVDLASFLSDELLCLLGVFLFFWRVHNG